MNTITIPKKEYKDLLRRQQKFEEELGVVKSLLQQEVNEERIKPSVLKRWERISRDMDRGKRGHVFHSLQEMKKWLKTP